MAGEDTRTNPFEPLVGPELSHAQVLRRTAEQATERGFEDVFIVDIDFHHLENQAWTEILEYLDNDVLRHYFRSGGRGNWWLPGSMVVGGEQEVQGRIQPFYSFMDGTPELTGAERDIARVREAMEAMSCDYITVFPTQLLDMGWNPHAHLEPHLARAWARWIVERVLAVDPRIITLLYLPFGHPEECLALIEEFGDAPGVVGGMVTSVRYDPNYTKEYRRLYAAMEERGLTLGFHGSLALGDRGFHQLNRFMAVHSISFPLYHMIQAANWITNGMPELFPNLKLLFIEGGLAWVPFLMQRLDHEYLMRPSEAPLLQRLPSEYMQEFFYSTQPFEVADPELARVAVEKIGADQLMWSSDWPHWDWDPPSKIWDLPYLTEAQRRNVLGETARRVFGLPPGSGRERDAQFERAARS
jgi:predicted TIM-barrel fold metal-dependent hydrolase